MHRLLSCHLPHIGLPESAEQPYSRVDVSSPISLQQGFCLYGRELCMHPVEAWWSLPEEHVEPLQKTCFVLERPEEQG